MSLHGDFDHMGDAGSVVEKDIIDCYELNRIDIDGSVMFRINRNGMNIVASLS
jgi:hypothetical protein